MYDNQYNLHTETEILKEKELKELAPFCRCVSCTSWCNYCKHCYGCLLIYEDIKSPQYVINETRAFKEKNPDFVTNKERREFILSIFILIFTIFTMWVCYDEALLVRQERFLKAVIFMEDSTPYDQNIGVLLSYPFMKIVQLTKLLIYQFDCDYVGYFCTS